jgi:hypothetical protein
MRYTRLPAFVLAFHGCDRATADRVVSGGSHLRPSRNDYDWLGHGIYFWENDPVRAKQWANAKAGRARTQGRTFEPAVVGATVDLGDCLNLLDVTSNGLLVAAHRALVRSQSSLGVPVPANRDLPGDTDRLLRVLDCAVINMLHDLVAKEGGKPFDSVRAAFIEGRPVYPGSAFRRKNHVQICMRDVAKISGYFHVRPTRSRRS